MRPFKVTATLLRGVSTEPYGLDLAGILASRVWRGRTTRPEVDSMVDNPRDLDIPLDICDESSEDWHWMGTCALVEVDDKRPIEPRTFYRVVNDSWASRAADRPLPYYQPRSGPWRDVMMPAPVTLTPRLTWYGVGEVDQVRDLLTPIRSLGKRRAKGEGNVLSWDVHEVDGDPWALAHTGEQGDCLLRPMPVECATRTGLPFRLEWHSIRPPSWNPNRLREIAVNVEEELYLPDEWEL